MNPKEFAENIPYWQYLGIELVDVSDGHAEVSLNLTEKHSSNEERLIAHGGVISSLADSASGLAALSVSSSVTPTIDLRIDYLAPATTDLRAEADVLRNGENTSVISCEVYDVEGTHIATARGVFKTGGGGDDTPWSRES